MLTLKNLLLMMLLFSAQYAFALSVNKTACSVLLSEVGGLEQVHLDRVDAIHPRTSSVLEHFLKISKIFRASKFEEEIRLYLVEEAKRLGFSYQVDNAGNLLIRVPSNQPHPEKQPWVALHSHLDMVADVKGLKIRKEHEDFLRKNGGVLPLEYKDGALQSVDNRNSIGNDDGSGVAIMMEYMLNDELPRPNLELLFTVIEEDGLIGAAKLELPLEAKKLISLDSGKQKLGLIGSNGATRRTLTKEKLEVLPLPDGQKVYSIDLSGLLGGHSGLEIDLGRANAVREMMSVVRSLRKQFPESNVVTLRGGAEGFFNRIPKNFSIELAIAPEKAKELNDFLQFYFADLKYRYNGIEESPELQLRIEESAKVHTSYISWNEIFSLSSIIIEMPDGPVDASWPRGVVDDRFSTNMSFLTVDSKGIRSGMMPRFYDSESLRVFDAYNQNLFDRHMPGLELKETTYSPEWKPAADSSLGRIFLANAHAQGLSDFNLNIAMGSVEASEFARIYKENGIDMIVIGVEVPDAHESTETLPLESLAQILKLLDTTMRQFIVR